MLTAEGDLYADEILGSLDGLLDIVKVRLSVPNSFAHITAFK